MQNSNPFILIMNNKDDESIKLTSMLKENYEVSFTKNIKDLLTIFNHKIPDLIILDLELYDMHGFEVLKELKMIDTFFNVPIIIISENTSELYETKCFKLGAADFIGRPYNPVVLKSRINTHITLRNRTKELEDIISDKSYELLNIKVNNLLNNIDEAIVSFDDNYIIEKGYSKKAEEFFNIHNLEGKFIDQILFKNDQKNLQLFKKTFDLIKKIGIQDKSRVDMCLSLLPQKIVLNKYYLKVRYKVLTSNKFMIVLEDGTQTKQLEGIIQEQLKTQKMIAAIASNRDEFIDLKNDFENFCMNIAAKIDSENGCKVFLRNLHTFKGLFAQKELVHIVDSIHSLEEKIKKIPSEDKNFAQKVLDLVNGKNLINELNQDILNAANILGETYFEERGKRERFAILDKLEKNLKYLIDHDIIIDNKILSNILSDITHLSSLPLFTHFISFPSLVKKTAKQLEKNIHPMKVEGDLNILVPSYIKDFTKTLVHIYRNCVDHGIEDGETRVIFYKDEYGTIKTKFYSQNDSDIVIEISDDGGGINVNQVVNKAISENVITRNEANTLSHEEKLALIFEDNITTKNTADVISGRGVGLAAVKQELEKLNGKIHISSNSNGTTFQFILPNIDRSIKKDELNIIVNDACEYFQNSFGLKIDDTVPYLNPDIKKEFVAIDFIGSFECVFGMCVQDMEVLKHICETLFPGDCEENIEELYIELAKEIVNTISGHAITELKRIGYEKVNITIPYLMESAQIDFNKNIVKSTTVETNLGNIVFFIIEKNEEK